MQVQPAAGWGITTFYVLTLLKQKRDHGCLIKLWFVLKVDSRTLLLPEIKRKHCPTCKSADQYFGGRSSTRPDESLFPGVFSIAVLPYRVVFQESWPCGRRFCLSLIWNLYQRLQFSNQACVRFRENCYNSKAHALPPPPIQGNMNKSLVSVEWGMFAGREWVQGPSRCCMIVLGMSHSYWL